MVSNDFNLEKYKVNIVKILEETDLFTICIKGYYYEELSSISSIQITYSCPYINVYIVVNTLESIGIVKSMDSHRFQKKNYPLSIIDAIEKKDDNSIKNEFVKVLKQYIIF